jgi:hypothetical protein
MRTTALLLAGLLVAGTLTVSLSAQQAKPGPIATTQKPTDVNTLLFEMANTMGMLRAIQQEDSIITLEHWAKGTVTTGGQKADVPEYRMSVNYAVPGMRVDYQRQMGTGKPQRVIEVVAGGTAWNETDRGMGATPARDRAKERAVMLWTTPMGVYKAAKMAGARATMKAAGANTWTLTFPLPAPAEDVTATATVRQDASVLARPNDAALKILTGTYITQVDTTGAIVSQSTYSEYGDWNWEDYKADIFLPRRLTRRVGDTTFDLTTVNTNTYNPYVIMPVPANVK